MMDLQGDSTDVLAAEVAELRDRVEKLEEFALSMADIVQVLEAAAEEPDDEETRQAWRAAHAAARARRNRERGR